MSRVGWWTLLGLIVVAPGAGAQTLHYEGGVSVASGDYIFTERTTSWTLHSGFAFETGRITLRATLPAYIQNTALLTGSAGGLLPTGGPHSGAVGDSSEARRGRGGDGMGTGGPAVHASSLVGGASANGGPVEAPSTASTGFEAHLGDPTAGISLLVWEGARTRVGLGATAKVPATDTTQFGTGEWDVGGAVSVSHDVGSWTLLGIDVSYWHLGDLRELELRDPVAVTVSVSFLRDRAWGLSGWASGWRSVVEGFDDGYSVGAGLTRLGSRGALGVHASVGLTETAPDFTLGIDWRARLFSAGP